MRRPSAHSNRGCRRAIGGAQPQRSTLPQQPQQDAEHADHRQDLPDPEHERPLDEFDEASRSPRSVASTCAIWTRRLDTSSTSRRSNRSVHATITSSLASRCEWSSNWNRPPVASAPSRPCRATEPSSISIEPSFPARPLTTTMPSSRRKSNRVVSPLPSLPPPVHE